MMIETLGELLRNVAQVTRRNTLHADTHNNNNRLTALFPGLYRGEPVQEEIFFWTLWCKGR